MSLFIASLNSGSNGNCYYIGNSEEAILVDAGLSCRETEKRLKRLGLCMSKVKAIFISHEHTDHVNGVNSICKKYNTPVFSTKATLQNSCVFIEPSLINYFVDDVPVSIASFLIHPFKKYHDANDPYSFVVSSNAIKVGVFTDIGKVCDRLIHHFKQCNAAFLESNYEEDMLANGNYPYYLKKRISGGLGHLSNNEALDLFTTHRSPLLSHLILSHLSKNNNCPKLVEEKFLKLANGAKIVVASRDTESELFEIKAANNTLTTFIRNSLPTRLLVQMKLFS